jgi:conjugal transfer pilus assembly protein TraL
MSQEGYWVPRTLDDPPMLLFFQADTASVFLVVFLLTISFSFIAGVLLAYAVTRVFVQLKENGDKGLIMQILYWYTPSDLWLSPLWSSSVREYCGR